MNRGLRIALGVLLGFLAINALPVGALFVVIPDGSAIGMTPAMLERGPFTSYRIPGLFLFALGAWHAAQLASLKVTDRAYIINNGRIFRSGTPEELGNDVEVKRIYLGDNFRLAV